MTLAEVAIVIGPGTSTMKKWQSSYAAGPRHDVAGLGHRPYDDHDDHHRRSLGGNAATEWPKGSNLGTLENKAPVKLFGAATGLKNPSKVEGQKK